ncbi:MAG: hypothetical protein K4571_01345 [Deltaproteobacteria bacterium]
MGIRLQIMFAMLLLPICGFAQGLDNYIIKNDIDNYKYRPKPTKEIYGNSGFVLSIDHFDEDHDDISYVTRYIKPNPILGLSVEVTQHAGSDSDKWLLHEVEDNYRDDEYETLGQLIDGAVMRRIDNNRVLWIGIGGGTFRWIRNNIVVSISYTDLQGTKPEPIEVVKAYLTKYPSTITATDAEFKSKDYNTKWIKDEMERRLWLCDKWSMHLQLGKVSQADMLEALVKHMKVFLNYRQKYYDMKAADEITAISTALQANDGTTIKNKLSEYKAWWNANKGKSIST